MKTQVRSFLCACLTLFITGCGGTLALIGFGKNGESIEEIVNEGKYEAMLKDSVLQVQETIEKAMGTHQTNTCCWELETVLVGFGVKGSIGFGPFQVAVKPRIRFAFMKDYDSYIP